MMKLGKALAAGPALLSFNAHADLKPGDMAPDFTAQATQGCKEFSYRLRDALKQGPVVVYFYPAAFTPGCTVEAHNFAEAIDQYKALGATVIGVSHDPMDKLKRFSASECRGKFPVAADTDGSIMKVNVHSLCQLLDFIEHRTSLAPLQAAVYVLLDTSPNSGKDFI